MDYRGTYDESYSTYAEQHKIGRRPKFEEVINTFDKAIKIKPQYVSPWLGKSTALKGLGRTAESDAALIKAKELGFKD